MGPERRIAIIPPPVPNPASRFTPETAGSDAEDPRCPSCGSDNFETAFESLEPGFTVQGCALCGLGRTWPQVPSPEIGKWYPEAYYGKENVRFNPLFEVLTRLFRKRRASVVYERVPKGKVLDVGCGRGLLLSYLRDLGYEAHGMEFSDTAAWHARNALGLDVETGDFLTSKHEIDAYNAVILWHSLEHLIRPIEAVTRARELLKPGGLLAIAVPNYGSLQARLFGRRWFHLDVPRHYWHFSVPSLEAVLKRHRFEIIKTDHFSFEQNPYGWVQSMFNAMGFEPNFLYSLLKNPSAREHEIRRHPVQAVLTVALFPFVLLASLLLTLVETALRSGGTIEIYAIKR